MYKKYLPSKKFAFTLLSIITALGLVYVSSLYKEKQTTNIAATESENNIVDANLNDNNATTTINQESSTAKNIDYAKAKADFNKLTTTEKMSMEIVAQYTNTTKNGSLLSPNQVQSIVDKALVYLPKMTFKTYSEKDIPITNSLDYVTLRNYSNSVAKIILNNLNNPTENIDSILADIDTNNDTKTDAEIKIIFQRFTPLINKNSQTISDLLSTTVPTVFIPEHLKFINSFEEIYEKLVLMQKSYNDMAVLVNVKGSYSTSVQNLVNALTELTKKLSVAGVTFASKNDYGYQLFNVIMTNN